MSNHCIIFLFYAVFSAFFILFFSMFVKNYAKQGRIKVKKRIFVQEQFSEQKNNNQVHFGII